MPRRRGDLSNGSATGRAFLDLRAIGEDTGHGCVGLILLAFELRLVEGRLLAAARPRSPSRADRRRAAPRRARRPARRAQSDPGRRDRRRCSPPQEPPAVGARAAPSLVCGCEPRRAFPSLARLAMRGVALAPAAIFAQLEPFRVVPLALIRLVVPAFALFTSESCSNPDVSTGHVGASRKTRWSGLRRRGTGVSRNAARRRFGV